MITHLKLFNDGDSRQVALFAGPNEQTDWQRNAPADEVLSGGWHLFPKEELIAIEEIETQGFLKAEALNPGSGDEVDPLRSWQLRCASLHNRRADAARERGDHQAEAEAATAVAAALAPLDEPLRQSAWLLRAVNARLAQWEQSQEPAAAVALAALFGQLASRPWPGEPDAPAKGSANQRFWQAKALERQAELSLQAEGRGDLAAAAAAAEAVVTLLRAA